MSKLDLEIMEELQYYPRIQLRYDNEEVTIVEYLRLDETVY